MRDWRIRRSLTWLLENAPADTALMDFVYPVPADDLVHTEAFRPIRRNIEAFGNDMFVVGVPGQFTVETLSYIQGMEQTLMDIVERPDFIKKITERKLEVSIESAKAMAQLGVEALYIGETFGQFMSPEQFKVFCLPYFQRFVDVLKSSGILIYLHMCGRVEHLFELAAETGVHCFEPIDEVAGTRIREAKDILGSRMALMGGVNTVVLSSGTVGEVRRECTRCIREAGENGGYILAACDMLPTETSEEKVAAMVAVAREEGRYRQQ